MMLAREMVRVVCDGCSTRETISSEAMSSNVVCLFCGGKLVENRRVTKTFGFGLCGSGKYRYDTRHAADRAERATARKHRQHLSVYRCHSCSGWHLGHERFHSRSR